MALLAPGWLLLLLLASWVIYLHWQRRSQRQQRVASLYIWQQVISELRASQRSRPPLLNWALVLQILALLALVVALSQPWWGQKPAGGNYLFVLENSLAMQGRPAPQQPTHLDWARRQLAQQLKYLPHQARVWLLVAGSQPYWLAHGWSSPADLLRALDTLEADWGQPNWLQSQSLLGEAQPLLTQAQGHLYSQQGTTLSNLSFLASMTRHLPPPTGLNRSFGAVRVQAPEAGRPFWKIEGQVLASQVGGQITLETYIRPLGGLPPVLAERQQINLSGIDRSAFRVNLLLDQPTAVELRLPNDSLTPDNHHHLILRPQVPRRKVLWLGPRSASLEQALSAAAPLDIAFADQPSADQPPTDLTVVNQTTVSQHPGGSVLWVAAALEGVKPAQATPIPAGESAHILSRGITWSRLKVAAAHPLTRQPGAEVVWGSADQPLIQARTTEQGREVWLSFALEDSNWATLPDLPAFASNWLAWTSPQPPSQCWSGQECAWPADQFLAAGQVWLEGNQVAQLEQSGQPTGQAAAPRYWLRQELAQGWWPLRAGFYQLRWGALQQEVAVNVRAWPGLAAQPANPAAPQPIAAGQPLWGWLLLLALLLGGVEVVWQGYRRERLGVLGWRNPGGRLNRSGWVGVAYLISGLLLVGAILNPVLGWPQRVLASLRVVDAAPQTPNNWPRDGLLVVHSDLGLALQQATRWAPYPLEIGVQSRGLAPYSALLPLYQQLASGNHQLVYQPQLPGPLEQPYLVSVSGPDQPRPKQPFLLETVIYSPQKALRTLQIEREGQVLAQQQVAVQPGENRVEVELVERSSGWVNYRLQLIGARQAAWPYTVRVGSAPRIGLLTPNPKQARAWQQLLAAQGLEVEILPPERPNLLPARLASWQGLILANYPARNLTPDQQKQLEDWVGSAGGGLALLGGRSSFGPGGYYKTPLDRLSPLSSRVPNEAPKAALLFVIDKSGSMNQPSAAGRRIDIARAATLEAIRLLHPESLVGVIAYDSEARVWLPLQRPGGNLPAIEAGLGRLEPGGGTALKPALEQALQLLAPIKGLSRHVILLSDGLSEVGDFEPLARQFAQQNISLSTVAVGEGSDIKLVEQLARWGGGSWYIPQNWEEIPAILAQETLLRSTSPVVSTPFVPAWTATERPYWLSGWPNNLPALGGYIKTTLKPGATLWLSAPGNLPLLAHWRYGSGEVLAFTSDPLGDWAGGWSGLVQQAAMWAAAFRPLGKQPSNPSSGRFSLQPMGSHLQLTLYPGSDPEPLWLKVSDSRQQRIPPLSPGSEPAQFSQTFTPRPLEAYRFEWASQAVQVWGPPPLPANSDWVERMTSLTLASQGRIADPLPPPRYLWRWQPQPSWLVFGLLALLVYLLALGLRYRV